MIDKERMEAEAAGGEDDKWDWKKIVPKGFHFHPTESELIVNFLHVKILGGTIPPGIIKDQDLYEFPPNELLKGMIIYIYNIMYSLNYNNLGRNFFLR